MTRIIRIRRYLGCIWRVVVHDTPPEGSSYRYEDDGIAIRFALHPVDALRKGIDANLAHGGAAPRIVWEGQR